MMAFIIIAAAIAAVLLMVLAAALDKKLSGGPREGTSPEPGSLDNTKAMGTASPYRNHPSNASARRRD